MASDKRRDSPEYWEARLKRMGLDADRGRPTWLSYGHSVTDLDTDGRKLYPVTDLKTDLSEGFEWPVSFT